MFPIALGCILAAAAVAVWLSSSVTARRAGGRRPVDRQLEQWANIVRHRLPAAFDALQLSAAGAVKNGRRPPVRVRGAGAPAGGGGWRYVLDLPGSSIDDDVHPERLAGAVNTGGVLVDVAEVRRHAAGWADLTVWRRDPLTGVMDVPWQPGSAPDCVRRGEVCVGMRRDGGHIHMTVHDQVGAMCALFAGRRGSGKSEAMRLTLAQMLQWGYVRPIVVDTVRQGVDFAAFGVDVVTSHKEAVAAIREVRAECDERAKRLRAQGRQKLTAYSREVPLLAVVVDEVHSLLADKGGLRLLTDFARESRPVGGALFVATQYPDVTTIPSALRMQLASRWCGKVSNLTEARVVLGDNLPEGGSPHLLRNGPGSCVVDLDGAERVTGRTWHMTPRWLDAHVKALAGVSV